MKKITVTLKLSPAKLAEYREAIDAGWESIDYEATDCACFEGECSHREYCDVLAELLGLLKESSEC